VLGPSVPVAEKPAWPELVEAAELVEQLPELPLTPDGEFVLCVLDELLQLYAFAIGANVGARTMAMTPAIEIANNKDILTIQVIVCNDL
jgi:hypothetical protein